jgi:hypothetical protein
LAVERVWLDARRARVGLAGVAQVVAAEKPVTMSHVED